MKNEPFLTTNENRAVHRLSEQACHDEACGDAGCTDIRRTIGAVKRLIARLATIRNALEHSSDTT